MSTQESAAILVEVVPVHLRHVDDLPADADLVLDAQGDPNARWIFSMASELTVANSRQVTIIGGGSAANVFWQVGSSATLGTGSSFVGTIMADQSISFATGAVLRGRALARIAAVTLDSTTITLP